MRNRKIKFQNMSPKLKARTANPLILLKSFGN